MPLDNVEDDLGGLIPQVMQIVRGASALAAQDVNFYKSIDKDISSEIDNTKNKLHSIVEQLLQASSDDFDDNDFSKEALESDIGWKRIGNVLDNVFERIDTAFDEAGPNNKKKQADYIYLNEPAADDRNSHSHTGKRLAKPQLKFSTKVDNSESHPFKPKISTKPNSLLSYDESTQIIIPSQDENTDETDPPHYMQPYEYEIDRQEYPDSILSKSEPIPPQQWEGTEAKWIDTAEDLAEMIAALKDSEQIAVDLEHHDYRTYYGLVCLMQISNRSQDWIIDTLALRDQLEPLNEVFTDPSIIKVFHGAFMDIIWLQRDLGLYIVSLFDTYHASKKLGFPKFSLAYLLETFANFKTSKKYQLSDWRIRPLSPPMMAYARSDTHFLLNIFDQLKNKLIDSGNDKLSEVLYESRQVAKRRFEYTSYRPLSSSGGKVSCPVMSNNPKEPYSSLMAQYNIPGHKRAMVQALYEWRDRMAKEADESVRYVMPNQLLVGLANLESPIDAVKVLNVPMYISEHVRLHAKEIAELLEATLRQVAESDWALADKWDTFNDQGINGLNGEENNHEVIAEVAAHAWSRGIFASLPISEDLITLTSSIFSNKDNPKLAIEYDVKENKIKKSNLSECVDKRREFSIKELQKFGLRDSITLDDDSPTNDNITNPEVSNSAQKQSEASTEDITSRQKPEDPNEIIVLRKKQPFKHSFKQETPDQSGQTSAVDYENADKMMLEVQNPRKTSKRKKAFDPYSKDNVGPAPAKRNRKPTAGRTATYSRKK